MKIPEHVADRIQQFIRRHPEHFQLHAHFMNNTMHAPKTAPIHQPGYGKYNSSRSQPYPFYKPYSKIVNINAIQ